MSESQYRWSESHQVLHMIDGAKPEIEGMNHDIDGAKCQVVEYFLSSRSKIVYLMR